MNEPLPHSIVMQSDRWLPTLAKTVADPFVTLRNQIDVQKLFTATVVDEEETKKFSLKRMSSKKPKDEKQQFAKLEAEVAGRIADEIQRIIRRLSQACEVFADLAYTLGDVKNKQQRTDLAIMIPYMLLDASITKHQCLAGLFMADNRLYIAIGRAQLQSHVYSVTAAHGYSLINAENRMKRITSYADVWLTELFKDRAKLAMPVGWQLDDEKYEELPEKDIEQHTRRMMCEMPLLMLALFQITGMNMERDRLLDALMQHTF